MTPGAGPHRRTPSTSSGAQEPPFVSGKNAPIYVIKAFVIIKIHFCGELKLRLVGFFNGRLRFRTRKNDVFFLSAGLFRACLRALIQQWGEVNDSSAQTQLLRTNLQPPSRSSSSQNKRVRPGLTWACLPTPNTPELANSSQALAATASKKAACLAARKSLCGSNDPQTFEQLNPTRVFLD